MTDRDKGRGRPQDTGSSREGFGDDGGTRVGRPDPARGAEGGNGPSTQPVKEGLEGAVFEDGEDDRAGSRSASGSGRSGQPTGAGAEAAEGTHDAMRDRSPSENSGVDAASDQNADKGNARRGSEPLTGRDGEHVSGYGGRGGEPRTSSDQRE